VDPALDADAIAAAKVIRLPEKASRQLAAVRSAETQLARLGPVSDEAIAVATHLSVKTVRSLRAGAQVVVSLDEPVGEDATMLGDLIADDRAVDPGESALAHEQHDAVTAMLRLLPARHRAVLVRRYGLDGADTQSHEQIGRWLGVGEERSRQLERESLQRLRALPAHGSR
jgi:DNA-directed RNA polymerase sigma subunit (sigma70/sigma32)